MSKQETQLRILGTESGSVFDLGEGIYQLWNSSVSGGGMTVTVRIVDRGPDSCDVNMLGIAHVEGTQSSVLRKLLTWNLRKAMALGTKELGQVLPGLAEQSGQNGTEPQLG